MKKAQITIFMIVGFMILIIFGLLYAQKDKLANLKIGQENKGPIQNYVESCLDMTTSYGIGLLGMQGGYITPPTIYYNKTYGKMGFGFYEGTNTLPTLDEIKLRLQDYINQNINNGCLDDFSTFRQKGYQITYQPPTTEVIFTDKLVEVKLNMPIEYTVKQNKMIIDSFVISLPVRMKQLHEHADMLMQQRVTNPEYINMSYMGDMDMNAYVMTYNDAHVYIMEDPKSKVFNKPYRFLFAAYPLQ